LWKFVKPAKVDAECRSGALGCVANKTDFAEQLNDAGLRLLDPLVPAGL